MLKTKSVSRKQVSEPRGFPHFCLGSRKKIDMVFFLFKDKPLLAQLDSVANLPEAICTFKNVEKQDIISEKEKCQLVAVSIDKILHVYN